MSRWESRETGGESGNRAIVRVCLIFGAGVLLLLVGAVGGNAATDAGDPVQITGCINEDSDAYIDEPGHYVLQNGVAHNETCIKITASDVVLDGNGHTVQGIDSEGMDYEETGVQIDGTESATGTIENVTVRDVTIAGWRGSSDLGGGLGAQYVHDLEIHDVVVTENIQRGVLIRTSKDVTFRDNVVNDTTKHWGMVITSASLPPETNVTVTNNTFENNGWFGLRLWNSANGTYTHNEFVNNGWYDGEGSSGEYPGLILAGSDTRNNTVENNVMIGNDGAGIEVAGSDNRIVGNTIEENGKYGISTGPSNTFTDNVVRVDGDSWHVETDDVDLESEYPATFEGLDVGDSPMANTTVELQGGDVQLRSNASAQPGAPALDGAKLFFDARDISGYSDEPVLEIGLSYEDRPVTQEDEETLRVYAYDATAGEWVQIWHSYVDAETQTINVDASDALTSTDDHVTFGVFSGGEVNGIDSTGTIRAPGTYRLETNLQADDTALEIRSGDVYVDGKNHSITGDDLGDWTREKFGVHANGSAVGGIENVTVTDVNVTGWETDYPPSAGILFEQVDDGEISDVVATENRDGVRVLDSSGISLQRNTIVRNSDNGISLDSSDDNELLDSNVSSNDDQGISLEDASSNTLVNNTITHNDRRGVDVSGASNGNTLVSNFADSNLYGFYLADSADDTRMENNTATANNYGMYLTGDTDTVLTNSTVRENLFSNLYTWDSTNLSVETHDIGHSTESGTTLAFQGTDIDLRSVETPPDSPVGVIGVGRYFEAESLSTPRSGPLDVAIRYDDADVSGIDESTLSLWKHDGSGWNEVEGSGVDPTTNVVTASITEFSTFGAFGEGADDASFDVEITDTNTPVVEGDTLVVDVSVSNVGTGAGTRTVTLYDFDGDVAASESVQLDDGHAWDGSLTWETESGGAAMGDVTVTTGDDTDSARVTVEEMDESVVTDCTEITESGSYELAKDLASSDDSCIEITAADVVFDGMGYTITGEQPNPLTFGVEVTADNVTVRDLTVKGWTNEGAGVFYEDAHDGEIRDVTTTENFGGIVLSSATENVITDATVSDNLVGVSLIGGSSDNTITDSFVTGAEGAYFSTTEDSTATAQNLNMGESTAPETSVSFVMKNVAIEAGATPPANSEAEAIERYLDVDPTGQSAYLDLQIHYDDGDLSSIDETTLSLWEYREGEWGELDDSTVDTVAKTVEGNVTRSSTIGVFGDEPTSDTSSGRSSSSSSTSSSSSSTPSVSPGATPTPTATPDPANSSDPNDVSGNESDDAGTPEDSTADGGNGGTPDGAVNDGAAGQPDDEADGGTGDDTEIPTEASGPGFGILVALGSLLAIGLLRVR